MNKVPAFNHIEGISYPNPEYLKTKEFTTSMNRKVCWENGFKEGKQEAKLEFIKNLEILGGDIITANKTKEGILDLIKELKSQLEAKHEK